MECETELSDFIPTITYRGIFDEEQEYKLGDVILNCDGNALIYVTDETTARWEPLYTTDISAPEPIRTHPTNCKCCGAILTSWKCEYCGAEY